MQDQGSGEISSKENEMHSPDLLAKMPQHDKKKKMLSQGIAEM